MKKILGLVAVMAIFTGNLFAWTNFIGLGLKVPAKEALNMKLVNSDNKNITYSDQKAALTTTGFDLTYQGTFDNGFSLKYDGTFNMGPASEYLFENHNNEQITASPFGLTMTDLLGIGYSFINTEKLQLSAFGNIGAELMFAWMETKETVGSSSTEYPRFLFNSAFLLGGDVTCVFNPVKVFALYGSVSANAAFGSGMYAYYKTSYELSTDTYFLVVPRIGIGWRW